jgi:MoaA/NifB/PqqE/SkfB family radical SAM enzyme
MGLKDKIVHIKLVYKEKFRNSYSRQLLRLGKMLLKRPVASMGNGAIKVFLGLTYRCQCNCIHCSSGLFEKSEGKELATSECEDVIDQVNKLPSIFTVVSFFGGEPLLRDDIYHLIKYTSARGIFCEAESNGILLSVPNVKKLRKSGLHHLFVSIDSPDPEEHNTLRKKKECFNLAIQGIKNCVKEGLSCSISTYTRKNKIYNGDLEKIIELGKELKVTSIRFIRPILTGKFINSTEERLSLEEEEQVKKLLRPDFVYLETTHCYSKEIPDACPAFQKKTVYVSPYGDIQPCPLAPLQFGNIRNESFITIINKMWNDPMFQYKLQRVHLGDDCPMNDLKFRDKYIVNSNDKLIVKI